MKYEHEYSNWKQVALCLATATALLAVGEITMSIIATVVAIGLTAQEMYCKKGQK